MKRAVLIGLLAAAGCGGYPNGWETEWNGLAPLPGYETALDLAAREAPCPVPMGGLVVWSPGMVACGGVSAFGCMDYEGGRVRIDLKYGIPTSATALMHELAHVVFRGCGLPEHTEAFIVWEATQNAKLWEMGF